MPRLLARADNHDRNRSLGWLATAWMEFFLLHGPGDVQGQPVVLNDEQVGFNVDCYAVDEDGRRLYDSAFLSRPKGCDKSGGAARVVLFEALGPCRVLQENGLPVFAEGGEVYEDPYGLGFVYEYSPGEPIGRPVVSPIIRCMSTEEKQSGLVYDTVLYNLTEGALSAVIAASKDAGMTRTILPGGGEILPSTASAASKDGGKETHIVADETHLWTTKELKQTYRTVTRNLGKRGALAEPWLLETTTWFSDQEESVAKDTFKFASLLKESKGKKRGNLRHRLLFDHQWADIDEADVQDEKKLLAALSESYGESADVNGGWVRLKSLVDQIYDPRNPLNESMRYFFNAPSSSETAFLQAVSWTSVGDPTLKLQDGDTVTLGFDGSRGRPGGRTKPDATALVACRLSDMALFKLGIWEASGIKQTWAAWQPPDEEVEALIRDSFTRYRVVGFYGDPAGGWQSMLVTLERDLAASMPKGCALGSANHPFHWWMTGGRSAVNERAIYNLEDGVLSGTIKHEDSAELTRHILNAHRGLEHGKLKLVKRTKDSADKIDGAIAAILAYQAACDASSRGATKVEMPFESVTIPSRIGRPNRRQRVGAN